MVYETNVDWLTWQHGIGSAAETRICLSRTLQSPQTPSNIPHLLHFLSIVPLEQEYKASNVHKLCEASSNDFRAVLLKDYDLENLCQLEIT